MNLIEQQNVLKGLTDEHLAGEMQSPSGSAPPYLVLTELNRRKSMRERYDGEKARQARNNRTVAEDIVGSMGIDMAQPAPQMGGGGAPQMPAPMMGGGLPPPSPTDSTASVPSFAGGGIVPGFAPGGPIDYEALNARYSDMLGALPAQRDRARAMALITAGAGMMGGKSSNAFTNIGGGVQQGLTYYQDQMNATDSDEMSLLRDAMNLGQTQRSDELARLEYERRERDAARQALLDERQVAVQEGQLSAGTADQQNFEYRQGLSPTNQVTWDRIYNSGSSAGSAEDRFAQSVFRTTLADVAEAYAESPEGRAEERTIRGMEPAEQAAARDAIADRLRQKAIDKFAMDNPLYAKYAALYAEQSRNSGGAATGAAAPAAPAAPVVDYTTFF